MLAYPKSISRKIDKKLIPLVVFWENGGLENGAGGVEGHSGLGGGVSHTGDAGKWSSEWSPE